MITIRENGNPIKINSFIRDINNEVSKEIINEIKYLRENFDVFKIEENNKEISDDLLILKRNFVGIFKLGEEIIFIEPKINLDEENEKNNNFLWTYLSIMMRKIKNTEKLLYIYPKKKININKITIQDEKFPIFEITWLFIILFLNEFDRFIKHPILKEKKRNFKIKSNINGAINWTKTIQKVPGRFDLHVISNYNKKWDFDIWENQHLKVGLNIISRILKENEKNNNNTNFTISTEYIQKKKKKKILKLQTIFKEVKARKIPVNKRRYTFRNKHYKRIHEIIDLLDGFNNIPINEKKKKINKLDYNQYKKYNIPFFFINTADTFEGYIRTLIEEYCKDKKIDKYIFRAINKKDLKKKIFTEKEIEYIYRKDKLEQNNNNVDDTFFEIAPDLGITIQFNGNTKNNKKTNTSKPEHILIGDCKWQILKNREIGTQSKILTYALFWKAPISLIVFPRVQEGKGNSDVCFRARKSNPIDIELKVNTLAKRNLVQYISYIKITKRGEKAFKQFLDTIIMNCLKTK